MGFQINFVNYPLNTYSTLYLELSTLLTVTSETIYFQILMKAIYAFEAI